MMKLFIPFAMAKNIYEIDVEFYKKFGIDTIVCDLDNTLDAYYQKEPSDKAIELVSKLKAEGFKFIIISNNTKERVKRYADKIECEFIHSARKPLKYRSKNFFKKNNIDPTKTICIGDQVFTDVAYANRMKFRCILCENLVEKDQFFTKFNKSIDRHFRKSIVKNKLARNWREMLWEN